MNELHIPVVFGRHFEHTAPPGRPHFAFGQAAERSELPPGTAEGRCHMALPAIGTQTNVPLNVTGPKEKVR